MALYVANKTTDIAGRRVHKGETVEDDSDLYIMEPSSFNAAPAVNVTLTGTADPYGSGVVDLTSADGGLEINHGSTGTPVATIGPNLRVTRVEALAATTGGGTNLMNEKNAAGVFISTGQGTGTAGDYMQTNAVFAFAKASGSGVWDAVAINAVGKSTSSNERRGTAAYLEGLKDNTTGKIIAVEVRSNNQTESSVATDDDYSTTGASNTLGLWVACSAHASANQTHGAGIQLGRTGTAQWGVGVGFTDGSVATTAIQDDSSATSSIVLNGSHTYGLDLNGGTFSGAAIRLANAMSLKWRNAAGSADYDCILLNSSNELAFGVSASQVTLVRFHRSLALNDSVNIATGTSTGTKVGTATTQKIGFYNATPIVQPSGIGAAATDAATTQTLANNLRTALINLGLVAA